MRPMLLRRPKAWVIRRHFALAKKSRLSLQYDRLDLIEYRRYREFPELHWR
jgi:hypothetical protein